MIEELYFQDEAKPKVSAASVGISKLRWVCAYPEDLNNQRYAIKMKENRFDVLPIEKDNEIKEYFRTQSPNDYVNIEKHKIQFQDTIDLRTEIDQIISSLNQKNRTFYFLTLNSKIKGLITVGNLNCKQVQVHIFHLICELERCLGDFLNDQMTNEEILDWALEKSDKTNPNDKYAKMVKSYNELVEDDLENKFTEHFFFVDFFNLIREKKLNVNLDLSSNEWKKYNSINEIRNRIAHPTRSLIDRKNTLEKLDKRLDKIKELTYKLKENTPAITR